MSEVAFWLNYLLAGLVAFIAVYFGRWKIVPSLLAGTALTLAIYLAVSIMSGGTFDDPWLAPALMINGSFSMIFGAVGAAIGMALRAR